MTIPEYIFFHEELKNNAIVVLHADEAAHARTLRLRESEKMFFTDGNGQIAEGRVVSPSQKRFEVEIKNVQKVEKNSDFYIHIAVSPTKNADRIEWFLEKAIEIGIDEISFIEGDFSEKKAINSERLFRKAIAAMKQSHRFYLPKINPLISFQQFLAQKVPQKNRFIAHLIDDKTKTLFQTAKPKGNYCVLIGAEGGFSEKEIQKAIENQFETVSLGKSRLRTETAALTACITLNILNE